MRNLTVRLGINITALMVLILLLLSCNGKDIQYHDGDKLITQEIDDVISNHIIQHYKPSAYPTEKQFEVHKVYGTREKNDELTVYFWSYFGGYNKSTGTENQTGHSLPAAIQLKKEADYYEVIKYTEPQDGSLYQASLKKMFPEKYLNLVHSDSGNIKDLQIEMELKVEKWLAE